MINTMKKLIIAILLFSLAGCTTNTQLGAELPTVEEINEINIDGVMTSIEFTDDNTDEDIIIKSDQKEYFNLGGTFTSYFSVENKTGLAQDIDTVFALKTGDVLEVSKYEGYTESDIIVVSEKEDVYATSTEKLGASKTEKKTTSKWKSKNLKKADKYKKDKVKIANNKGLLGATNFTRKDIKETDATKIFTDTFAVGEKKFYKASIKITSGDREEFFIEAFGNIDGYGKL